LSPSTRHVFAQYQRLDLDAGPYRFCPLCAGGLTLDEAHAPPRLRCAACGWINYRNPSPGVTVLIADGDQVLLGRRGPGSFAPDLWCLPGGFMEFEEDWVAAAVREVGEETGLEVEARGVVNVCTNYLARSLHTLVIVVRAEIIGGEAGRGRARAGDDLVQLRWVGPGDPLPEMAFEADRHIVERWRAGALAELPVGVAGGDLPAATAPGHGGEIELCTLADRPDLVTAADELISSSFPAFTHHDRVGGPLWPRLWERYPECQQAVVEPVGGEVVGSGFCVPLDWQGSAADLPDQGWRWAMKRGLGGGPGAESGAERVLCAVAMAVSPSHRGLRLSTRMLEGMRSIGRDRGLEDLIAPVRPTRKADYPLVPMEEYARWTTPAGEPFDPWIRIHTRLGARVEKVCPRSLEVEGAVAEWEEWSGLSLPASGDHVIPEALVPVHVDRDADVGTYTEPNVWLRHSLERPA